MKLGQKEIHQLSKLLSPCPLTKHYFTGKIIPSEICKKIDGNLKKFCTQNYWRIYWEPQCKFCRNFVLEIFTDFPAEFFFLRNWIFKHLESRILNGLSRGERMWFLLRNYCTPTLKNQLLSKNKKQRKVWGYRGHIFLPPGSFFSFCWQKSSIYRLINVVADNTIKNYS